MRWWWWFSAKSLLASVRILNWHLFLPSYSVSHPLRCLWPAKAMQDDQGKLLIHGFWLAYPRHWGHLESETGWKVFLCSLSKSVFPIKINLKKVWGIEWWHEKEWHLSGLFDLTRTTERKTDPKEMVQKHGRFHSQDSQQSQVRRHFCAERQKLWDRFMHSLSWECTCFWLCALEQCGILWFHLK